MTRFHLLALALLLAPAAVAQHGPQPEIDPGYPVARAVLITGGHWFDVHEGAFRPNAGILAVNGRFLSVGDARSVPDGALVVTLDDDRYILPGIVDLHAHYNVDLVGEGRVDETVYNPLVYLANGVTTTFTAGEYDPHEVALLRDQIAAGEKIGARVLTAGPYFGSANPDWDDGFTDEDVYALVDEWAARGAAGFKAKGAAPHHLEALIRRAHDHGLTVTGHLDSGFRGSTNSVDAIRMGIDRIEHILGGYVLDPEQPAYPVWNRVDTTEAGFRAIVRDFIEHRVHFSATVTAPVYFGSPDGTEGFDDWADEQAFFTPYVREAWERRRPQRTGMRLMDELHRTMLRTTKAFYDAGGGDLITLGTDKPAWGDFLPGFSAHREIHALVLAGIPAASALRIATINGAAAIGGGGLLGSIEPGKLADLLVVRGDPLEEITNTRNVEAVMKAGRLYDPQRLLEVARGSIGPTGLDDHAGWRRPPAADPLAAQRAFFENLRALCGRTFGGRTIRAEPGDRTFEPARLHMAVEECDDHEIRVPFVVDGDDSRTWVFQMREEGLTFFHVHLRDDGTEYEASGFGGHATADGTATFQSFPDFWATDETPPEEHRIWRLRIDRENDLLVYYLDRGGRPAYRLVFYLGEPSPTPGG